jgi:hypothetical protein
MILDYQDLLTRLLAGKPFALSRYGDGEWAAIFGIEGENCDHHKYFPEMGIDLLDTLRSHHKEPYYYGMVRIAITVFGKRIQTFITRQGLNQFWIDGTAMADASKAGKLYSLIDLLQHRKILYVGPAYLNTQEFRKKLFVPAKYIEVPAVDCYLQKEKLVETIAQECLSDTSYDLIGFSAGPATEIMMWELWTYLKASVTMIDFGSLWDGFVGNPSRKYQKDPSWKELIDRNLQYEY